MSIFNTGEEVICVEGFEGYLVKGKHYIVLGQGKFCNCCIDVGIGNFCFEWRFRRPIVIEDETEDEGVIHVF